VINRGRDRNDNVVYVEFIAGGLCVVVEDMPFNQVLIGVFNRDAGRICRVCLLTGGVRCMVLNAKRKVTSTDLPEYGWRVSVRGERLYHVIVIGFVKE
jgi:hypothetical protein